MSRGLMSRGFAEFEGRDPGSGSLPDPRRRVGADHQARLTKRRVRKPADTAGPCQGSA